MKFKTRKQFSNVECLLLKYFGKFGRCFSRRPLRKAIQISVPQETLSIYFSPVDLRNDKKRFRLLIHQLSIWWTVRITEVVPLTMKLYASCSSAWVWVFCQMLLLFFTHYTIHWVLSTLPSGTFLLPVLQVASLLMVSLEFGTFYKTSCTPCRPLW